MAVTDSVSVVWNDLVGKSWNKTASCWCLMFSKLFKYESINITKTIFLIFWVLRTSSCWPLLWWLILMWAVSDVVVLSSSGTIGRHQTSSLETCCVALFGHSRMSSEILWHSLMWVSLQTPLTSGCLHSKYPLECCSFSSWCEWFLKEDVRIPRWNTTIG